MLARALRLMRSQNKMFRSIKNGKKQPEPASEDTSVSFNCLPQAAPAAVAGHVQEPESPNVLFRIVQETNVPRRRTASLAHETIPRAFMQSVREYARERSSTPAKSSPGRPHDDRASKRPSKDVSPAVPSWGGAEALCNVKAVQPQCGRNSTPRSGQSSPAHVLAQTANLMAANYTVY